MATASERNQALLNNRTWQTKDFREQQDKIPPVIPNVNLQDNMLVALKDPVYGQGTATGLAAGQSMLNSWIGAANAIAKKEADKLANERWIKVQDDLAKERELRQAELDEAKKRYLPGVSEVEDPFLSPEDQKALDAKNKNLARGQIFNNPVAYEQALDAQRRAVEERQKFLDSRRRNLNITGEALDAAGATKGMTKEQAMDKYGVQRHDKSWLPKWMGGTTEFEDSVSNLFKRNYGDPRFNRMTPIQLINRFQNTGNERGANKIRALIGNLVKEGNKIDEIVGGVRPEDPVYVRIGGQAYILEPNTMSLKDVTLR